MEQIKHAIETGALQPGEQLPGIRKLAEDLVINPNTVAKVYCELEHEGVVELRQGAGAFVAERAAATARADILRARPLVRSLLVKLMQLGLGEDEIYATASDKTLTILNLAGIGEIREGFDARLGWSQDPINGFREKKGVELALVKRGSVFHRDLKLRELYAKMEMKGKEKVGDRDAWLVIATPAEGAPEKMYFDALNGMMIRSDVEIESPQGKMPFEIYLEDYRAVDGVKIPFVVRRVHPAMSMTVRLEEVKHNIAIEDAKFDRPAAQ